MDSDSANTIKCEPKYIFLQFLRFDSFKRSSSELKVFYARYSYLTTIIFNSGF